MIDGIFPDWRWKPINPITKQPDEDFQPWNTTLPTCGKKTKHLKLLFDSQIRKTLKL